MKVHASNAAVMKPACDALYNIAYKNENNQILIGKVREYDYEEVKNIINELIKLFNTQNNELIVQRMKDLVPEFKSNNSVFQKLD